MYVITCTCRWEKTPFKLYNFCPTSFVNKKQLKLNFSRFLFFVCNLFIFERKAGADAKKTHAYPILHRQTFCKTTLKLH
jgi:hypothetical protein